MEGESTSLPSERPESDPDCLFEITEQQDPYNQKEMTFFIKIVVTKEMKARMSDIEKNKREKVFRLQQKERTPEMIALKERCEAIRKLDAKSIEEERKKNSGHNEVHKSLAEYEHHQQQREKYAFSLFESFQNRGRSPYIKFSYNSGEKHLGIRINKSYYLNQLHLSRRDLFNIAISFTRTWQFDFHGMIRVLWRIYTESERPINYNLFIRSLDLISATFDVVYHDKRIYRFRYSPFEFRTSPTFKDDNQLTGYYQSLSCIPELSTNSKSSISDGDFYSTSRLFIFDDLTDSNLFYKILNRTNLIYHVYSISKGLYYSYQGGVQETDEFAKKSLGQFYFSTTRLKKIMFTWSFRQFKRPNKEKKLKEDDKETREVILHIPFQLDRDNQSGSEPVYRMKMQILQMTKVITYPIKQDLAFRIKEWYLLVKELLCSRDKPFFQSQKQLLNRPLRNQRDQRNIQTEDFQMYVQFTSRDRFDKFFIGFLLLVSTVLDRHYFTLSEDKDRKREDSKVVIIDTQQNSYYSNKRQYIHHYHFLRLVFKHTYYPNMFYISAREEDKRDFYNFIQNSKSSDYRLKCGEWRLEKILKIKRKVNIKNKEDLSDPDEAQLTTFPEDFKKYIGILLRHFPLRLIYKDILSFVEAVCKTCYNPQEEANLMNPNGYDHVLRLIINVLLQQHYYCQFKQKQDKQKDKQKEKEREERSNNAQFKQQVRPRTDQKPELQYTKRDKAQDQFSKVLMIKIITRGDVGFTPEDRLLFEVTFKLLEFRGTWQTRIKEGSVVLRIFEDRLETERDYVIVNTLKGEMKNKKTTDEGSIKACLQACLQDPKIPTSL